MKSIINYQEYCTCLGIIGNLLPSRQEGVLHYRAFCLAELIFKKYSYEHIDWAEIKKISTFSDTMIVAYVQFNSCKHAFPLHIPLSVLSGSKDEIENELSKLIFNLEENIKIWFELTKQGFLAISTEDFYKTLVSVNEPIGNFIFQTR